MAEQQSQFLDFYRAGMKTAVDAIKASLENAERVQNRQLEMVRNALRESTESASQLSNAKSLDEMLTLQTRFAGAQLERAMDFWTGVWRAAGDSQMAMIGQWQSQAEQMRERMRETYDLTARTTEGMARVATGAARDTASGARESVREAAQQSRQAAERAERKSA